MPYRELGDWECTIYGKIPEALITSVFGWKVPPFRKVILHDPATIILWEDGTKTVVKTHDEPFDPEKGICVAICKKMFGSTSKLKKFIQMAVEESK